MRCEAWDVVVVPFPFTTGARARRRPALVLTHRAFNAQGLTILAMITTPTHASCSGDTPLEDWAAAGLPGPGVVRLKLFTLDNRLLLTRLGRLAEADRARVTQQLRTYLG